MKQLIDMRKQDLDLCFAWWDTEFEVFENHSGVAAWNTWEEFVSDYQGSQLARYKLLCPAWVFTTGK